MYAIPPLTAVYESKPRRVDAIQVTEENLDAIAVWCEGYLSAGVSDTRTVRWVDVPTPQTLFERRQRAYPGDWILKSHANGRYKVVHSSTFKAEFEFVKVSPVDSLDPVTLN